METARGHSAVAGLQLKSQDTSYPPETDRSTALVSAKASPVVGHMMVNPRTTGTTSP
jgi:hypothetical protein